MHNYKKRLEYFIEAFFFMTLTLILTLTLTLTLTTGH